MKVSTMQLRLVEAREALDLVYVVVESSRIWRYLYYRLLRMDQRQLMED